MECCKMCNEYFIKNINVIQFIDNNDNSWEGNSAETTPDSTLQSDENDTLKQNNGSKRTWMQKFSSNKTKEEWLTALKDLFIFYSTAFSVVLSILSITAMMFLVPFFIDPAWSTLKADFNENGTTCYTKTGFVREGEFF